MEKIEYRQTGMIKIKDTAVGHGELQRLSSHEDIDYYDFAENSQYRWFDDIIL